MKSEGGHPVGGGEAMLPDEVGQSAIPPNRYVWQSVCRQVPHLLEMS